MACHGVELRGRGDKTVNARATTTGAPWEETLTGRGSRGPIHGFSGPEHLRSNRFFLAEGSVSCLAALVEAGMQTNFIMGPTCCEKWCWKLLELLVPCRRSLDERP